MSTLTTITKRLALIATGTFLLTALAAPLLAQADPKPADAPVVRKKTLMDHFHEGGWVMYPILICSFGTAYLCWEGANRTSMKKMAPPAHEIQVKSLFRAGDYIGAYDYCKNNPSPLTNTLRVGLSMLGEGKNLTEEAMFQQLAKEQSMTSTFLSYLSVIGAGNTLLVINDVRVLGAPTAQCAAGTYKPLVGNHICTACPASSTSVVGATSLAQCSCRVGHLDVWT